MEKDRLRHAAISLSVRLVQLYDQIERRSFLKNQLARAGTSIGANLFEARYAESPDDFVHKNGDWWQSCLHVRDTTLQKFY